MMVEEVNNPEQFQPGKIAIISSFAAMVGDMLMYPFDTIGTRIKANTKEFLNFRQGYHNIVKQEGHKYLYKGFSTTIAGSLLPYGAYFFVYEYLNKKCMDFTSKMDQKKYRHINLMIPLLTAPLAECVSVIIYIPFDTVRTRMQMNSPEFQYKGTPHFSFFYYFKGIWDGLKQIQEKEGMLRLFKASHMYMAQMIVFTGLQFWFYEVGRYQVLRNTHSQEVNKKLSIFESMGVTFISTLMAGFLVNPLDLLITRFQLIDSSKDKLSFTRVLNELLVHEGKKALFKGLGARLIQQCVFSMFYLPVYDHLKSKYGMTLEQ